MPLYEVLTTHGALDDARRAELAAGITAIHVEETGAPASFVHVMFTEVPPAAAYTGGAPSTPVVVRGQIRAGRPPEVRRAILERTSALCVAVARVPVGDVLVAVLDVPASWAMEGGRIFPDPDPAAERTFVELAADDRPPAQDT